MPILCPLLHPAQALSCALQATLELQIKAVKMSSEAVDHAREVAKHAHTQLVEHRSPSRPRSRSSSRPRRRASSPEREGASEEYT